MTFAPLHDGVFLRSVSKWFDEDGLLLADKFESDIKNLTSRVDISKKDQ